MEPLVTLKFGSHPGRKEWSGSLASRLQNRGGRSLEAERTTSEGYPSSCVGQDGDGGEGHVLTGEPSIGTILGACSEARLRPGSVAAFCGEGAAGGVAGWRVPVGAKCPGRPVRQGCRACNSPDARLQLLPRRGRQPPDSASHFQPPTLHPKTLRSSTFVSDSLTSLGFSLPHRPDEARPIRHASLRWAISRYAVCSPQWRAICLGTQSEARPEWKCSQLMSEEQRPSTGQLASAASSPLSDRPTPRAEFGRTLGLGRQPRNLVSGVVPPWPLANPMTQAV